MSFTGPRPAYEFISFSGAETSSSGFGGVITWVGINKQIEVHKSQNSTLFNAGATFMDVPLDEMLINSQYMSVSGSGIVINTSGHYNVMVQTSNDSIEMRISTSNGQSSFTTDNKHLRDVFIFQENEEINLKVRRGVSEVSSVLVPSGKLRMIIENR